MKSLNTLRLSQAGVAAACLGFGAGCTAAGPRPPGEPPLVAEDVLEAPPLRAAPVLGATPAPLSRPAALVYPADSAGMSTSGLLRVDSLIRRAIVDGASPGVALAIGRRGKLVRLRGYGSLDWQPGSPAVTDSTLYDLASLTKVVGTTAAVMLLADRGIIDLRAPISRYLPEWGGGEKDRVTAWHLLTHSGGLRAGGPVRPGEGARAVVDRIVATPLEYPPGRGTIYSDWDVVLLGEIVERVTQEPLDRLLVERIYLPIGMHETLFRPLQSWPVSGAAGAGDPEPLLPRIAPTEISARTGVARRGVVHDPIAGAMGGVAGNAGLFSSARDLALFAQMLLDGGAAGGQRLFGEGLVREFGRRQGPGSSRALGWDTPVRGASAGEYFSEQSFGHTGYTGTSIWIDPAQDLFVVLLTNRVHPTARNQKHVPLRRAVHDAVQQAIVDTPPALRVQR